MSLEILVLGSYAYTTMLLIGVAGAFLYITSWFREIALNHIPHLKATIEEMNCKIDLLMRAPPYNP